MMKSTVIDLGVLQLGDNQYEAASITLAAAAEVKIGAGLKRETNGSFSIAGASDTVVALSPSYFKNEGSASASLGFRALVGGRVRRDKVTIAGAAITDAQADALRDYGIIAEAVHDTSQLDNM
jgi:hypothetical protein